MGIRADDAYEALLRNAAPFQGDRRIDDGKPYHGQDRAPIGDDGLSYTDIPLVGRVTHRVFPEHWTVVNTTEPGHLLHQGNVIRRIVQEGDNIYVETQGYGTGELPHLNEKLGPLFWSLTDEGVRDALAVKARRRGWVPPSSPAPSTMEGFHPLSNLGRIPGMGDDGRFGSD